MRALIIYDMTGKIWNIVYGENEAPQGMPCLFVDIPEGAQIESIDLTDKDHPKAIFSYLPDSDISRMQKDIKKLQEELTNAQLGLVEQCEKNIRLEEEVSNLQLALVEVYEGR